MTTPDTAASSADPAEAVPANEPVRRRPQAVGYAVSVALVAAAGVVAFVVDRTVQAPNLSLVFVLPVILAAANFGWGPAIAAAGLGVAVDNFFFIEPRLTFRVDNPADLWALVLLLIVGAMVSTVAAQARRRALAAQRAADQAQALHALAHAVIRSEPARAVFQAAVASLGAFVDAPAVVLADQGGRLAPVAQTRGATLHAADRDAAAWALANDKTTRAETYPFDTAAFDFWPVQAADKAGLVLGVRFAGNPEGRPADLDRHVELVAGYLAAARPATAPRRRAR